MGGIAGMVSFTRSRIDTQKVERILGALHHRGPDDHGIRRSANGRAVVGGCRHLFDEALLPIPLVNETEDVWMVLDGDIDNHRALRHSLRLDGHCFQGDAPDEVVVHAYEQYGLACLDHLHGRFALALWDERRGRLILARDRLGERPLYWTRTDGMLAFASEGKVLFDAVPIPRRLDLDALAEYLAHGFVLSPHTLFAGIRKLGPGEALVIERGNRVQPMSWWSPCRDERRAAVVRTLSSESHETNLRILLDSAIADRLSAHLPIAAVLDGEAESLAMAATMGRLLGRPVDALALGEQTARRMAAPAAAAGVKITAVQPIDMPNAAYLPDFLQAMDEPLASPDAFGLWWLARAMSNHGLLFGLSSLGASQALIGADLLARHRPLPRVLRLLRALSPGGQRLGRRLAIALWTALGRNAEGLRQAIEAPLPGPRPLFGDTSPLRRPDPRPAAADPVGRQRRSVPPWLAGDQLGGLAFVEMRSTLAEGELMALDRTSAAHSVEMRLPFLDDAVVDYALAVPSGERARDGRPKDLLMRSLRGLPVLPPAEPAAAGGAPLGRDLAALIETAIQHGGLFRSGLVDRQASLTLLREHQAGLTDHFRGLWSLLVVSEWFDLHGLDIPAEAGAAQTRQPALG